MRRSTIVLAGVAALVLAAGSLASSVVTRLRMAGLPEVDVTLDGTSVAFTAVDSAGRADKRAAVVAAVVSGQAVKALLRVQRAPNGVFIDIVFSDTVTNLQTATNSLSLSTTTVGHPAPVKDSIDQNVLTAAGG